MSQHYDRPIEVNRTENRYNDCEYSISIFHSSNQASTWELSLVELRNLQQAIQEELDAADVTEV